jgi:hypothetical protein
MGGFNGIFVRFSTRGVKNTIKNFLGEVNVKNVLQKKLRKKNFFPVVFFLRFFIAFFAVSLCEELKNTRIFF